MPLDMHTQLARAGRVVGRGLGAGVVLGLGLGAGEGMARPHVNERSKNELPLYHHVLEEVVPLTAPPSAPTATVRLAEVLLAADDALAVGFRVGSGVGGCPALPRAKAERLVPLSEGMLPSTTTHSRTSPAPASAPAPALAAAALSLSRRASSQTCWASKPTVAHPAFLSRAAVALRAPGACNSGLRAWAAASQPVWVVSEDEASTEALASKGHRSKIHK
mmetsp:Transcript_49724/g.112927  ORF Transcript_49724/g.112927 Transcript_49724/m.112927 type:complete len:220 (-) Transcript_49724:2118-2777(-)